MTASRYEVRGSLVDVRLEPTERGISCRRAQLRNVDFSEQTLWYFGSEASTFEHCDFRRFVPEAGSFGAGRKVSVYRDCNFSGANLRGIDPHFARFERCSFSRAKIAGWFSFCAEFVSCRFDHAEIVGSKFSGTMDDCLGLSLMRRIFPPASDFYDNDFRTAQIFDTSFVLGVDLDRQMLPTGPEYIRVNCAGERLREARRQILDWTEGHERDEALQMIDVYEFDAADQDDLFARRDELDSIDADVLDRVWALLSGEPSDSVD